MSVARQLAALCAGALLLPACATYSDHMAAPLRSVSVGDYGEGIARLDRLLGVEASGRLPESWSGSAALHVLERATLQQAVGAHRESAADFQAADKQLEMLDIAAGAVDAIVAHLYSQSASRYRSSPTEKLQLNAFNMLNYLAQGDLRGARVEAQRFTVMRNYLKQSAPGAVHGRFGSYLAGFTFERLAESSRAMRHYDEALQGGEIESLRQPLRRLALLTPYRGSRVRALLEGTDPRRSAGSAPTELLVVVSVGRVPHKVPERMAVGAALGFAHAYVSGDAALLSRLATKFIVYPELVATGSQFAEVILEIDGRDVPLERVGDLGQEIREEYQAQRPKLLAAGISRMLVRAAAAEGARAAGREAGGEGLGLLASLLTEGALVAADRPDTRSWQLLPDQVFIQRQIVEPGRHRVRVRLEGAAAQRLEFAVDVPAGGFAAVVVTAPR